MSGQDLYEELSCKVRYLDAAVRELKGRGKAYAEAERDYKMALSVKVLTERDRGVPVTIISDICRGDRDIAKLRFERDVARVVYDSALEAINSYKLQIRILENQIQREWGQRDSV